MEANSSNFLPVIAIIAALLPLAAFLRLFIFGDKGKSFWPGISAIGISFILSAYLFFNIWNKETVHSSVNWFAIGSYQFTAGILLNNLSVLMLSLVSLISLVVHIYSAEYMADDPKIQRYWAYLGLFCFAMMALVIADNLFLIYMFWELVGFSSYLLIGFWFTKDSASAAAKKAFIINRIGDLGFLLGIFIILAQFHTLDIEKLFSRNGLVINTVLQNGFWTAGQNSMPGVWLTIAGLAFVLAAFSKSAQFPLHTWLPDAMEGPTSVSALIHAATMVAAGVFLLGRIYPLFDQVTLLVITSVGAFTAFAAACVALVQNDLKKILAFSTISQLGFMMLAMGVGAYNTSLFHLATHAFFKCLLFLVAGAIIHQLHHAAKHANLEFDYQDIRNMGGLRKKMPLTFFAAVIASAALIGLPLTSGYLSKDAILIRAFEWAESQSFLFKLIPYLAIAASWLTAFYITRLIVKVFFGGSQTQIKFGAINVHDAGKKISYSLLFLSLFCVFILFSINPLLFENSWIMNGFPVPDNLERVNLYHTIIPAAVNILSGFIIYFVWKFYRDPDFSVISKSGWLYRLAYNQGYVNTGYHKIFILPVMALSKASSSFDKYVIDGVVNAAGGLGIALASVTAWADEHIVDGLVNWFASIAAWIGNIARGFQTGKVQHYMMTMILIVTAIFILMYFSRII